MGLLPIDILGTSFAIQSNEDSDHLDKLLRYYRRIVHEVEGKGSLKEPLQISIVAGLMLCDELYKEKSHRTRLEDAVQTRAADIITADKITLKMIEKINTVLD